MTNQQRHKRHFHIEDLPTSALFGVIKEQSEGRDGFERSQRSSIHQMRVQ